MNKCKNFIFNYYVLFESECLYETYNPIIKSNKSIYEDTTYIWDKDLTPIIPAVWYILHLPRIGFDVLQMNIDLILSSHDTPHNIIPIPYCKYNKVLQKIINKLILNPTLILCEDKIYDYIVKDSTIEKGILGVVKVSEISSQLLQIHWNKLGDYIHDIYKETEKCVVHSEFRLTSQEERNILPIIPLANQFGFTEEVVKEIKQISSYNNWNSYILYMRRKFLNIYNKICSENLEFKNKTKKLLIENPNFNGVPLVITMSGIMSYQVKKSRRLINIPETEEEVIRMLGIHRAIAKNAMIINIDNISQELFIRLAELEEHCKNANKINTKFIWRTLRRLGRLINNKLKEFDIDIIETVSQITIFSDFPIGLAILPACSAPLNCIKPITYKPLTPLTRAFQYEVTKQNQVYLGKRCKILIAECVEKNDKIRKYCDKLTDTLEKMVNKVDNMELVIEEISSVKEFKNMLKEHEDAQILLVSAHGTYDIEKNMAGLCIGEDIWMAEDNDVKVPPVVLLSACHVMPRGRGVVCVGDLFIRAGATAVLGTFIPVDVIRNATLITRLFVDIIEVRKGWSNMRTLDEIWCHVVATNAIHEILSSSNELEKWANTIKSNGLSPQEEFKMIYSAKRLRMTHVYEDTIKVLYEIAERDGKGEYFNSVIKSKGYFPESLFYQIIGSPENVFIRNDIMEEYCKRYR